MCATWWASWPQKSARTVCIEPAAAGSWSSQSRRRSRRRLCWHPGGATTRADLSVVAAIPLCMHIWLTPPLYRRRNFVICDTPMRHARQGSLPGNFRNVIQNILYLFVLSPPRCSVSRTGRSQDHQVSTGSRRTQRGVMSLPESQCEPRVRSAREPRPRDGNLGARRGADYGADVPPSRCQSRNPHFRKGAVRP